MTRMYWLALLPGLGALPALAQDKLLLSDARVAPSGQRFAFSAATGARFGVYEQELAARSRPRRISPLAWGFNCYAPAYSPDGRYLLYLQAPVRAPAVDYADIILADLTTQTVRRLTHGQLLVTQALFSPDGQRIVYLADTPGSGQAHALDIYSLALDGSDPQRHTILAAQLLGSLSLLRAPNTYLLNVLAPGQQLAGTYAWTLTSPGRFLFVPDSAAASYHLNFLPRPAVSADRLVAYSIGDRLFIKNMRTGRSTLAYTGPAGAGPQPMSFVAGQSAVLFSERGSSPFSFGTFKINLLNLSTLSVVPVTVQVN